MRAVGLGRFVGLLNNPCCQREMFFCPAYRKKRKSVDIPSDFLRDSCTSSIGIYAFLFIDIFIDIDWGMPKPWFTVGQIILTILLRDLC